MSRYSKFLVALAGTVGIISSAMADGVFTSAETESIVLAAVSALFVFLVPNKPAPEA
ncbi:MAG TPA: hypothetical protein VLA89_06535 [Gemmatimonadales bacterium]|nr:hypothetical protein [Gemmatimonadales bacterium]